MQGVPLVRHRRGPRRGVKPETRSWPVVTGRTPRRLRAGLSDGLVPKASRCTESTPRKRASCPGPRSRRGVPESREHGQDLAERRGRTRNLEPTASRGMQGDARLGRSRPLGRDGGSNRAHAQGRTNRSSRPGSLRGRPGKTGQPWEAVRKARSRLVRRPGTGPIGRWGVRGRQGWRSERPTADHREGSSSERPSRRPVEGRGRHPRKPEGGGCFSLEGQRPTPAASDSSRHPSVQGGSPVWSTRRETDHPGSDREHREVSPTPVEGGARGP